MRWRGSRTPRGCPSDRRPPGTKPHALREALQDLAPAATRPEPTEEHPATADTTAEQHYQSGKQLKGGRKYAEAAEELRAAVKADPNDVDAHRVLAWVLIELNDTDGAATEFRKVIELAPGSDKAQEAQKALERLGG